MALIQVGLTLQMGMYITIDDSLTEAHIDGIIPVNTTTGDETYIRKYSRD